MMELMKPFAVLLLGLGVHQVQGRSTLSSYSAKELTALAYSDVASREVSSESMLNFYGKIITVCDFPDEQCFTAEVATGRTNFHGDGGDLANIYVPANDYDTWKQYMYIPTNQEFGSVPSSSIVEGEFIYQMRNSTLSCLTIELKWMFAPGLTTSSTSTPGAIDNVRHSNQVKEPEFRCVGTPIAMNWDCHLDWALTTECWYNSTSQLITAEYTITNLGHEEVDGEGKVVVVNKKDEQQVNIHVMKQLA